MIIERVVNSFLQSNTFILSHSGEDYAWRVQDPRAFLVGSREHGLPRHQQGLPSSPPQEDVVRTPNR